MRLKIPFTTTRIPLAYRMMVVSIIKEALKKADNSYYNKIYVKMQNQMKPFSSALFIDKFQIRENEIKVENVALTISSPDQEFMLHLYNGLLKTRKIDYRDFSLSRNNIQYVSEKQIRSSCVMFTTLSPLLIENKQGQALSPAENAYTDNLNYYADLILTNYNGQGLRQELSFHPINMAKQVVKESNAEFVKKKDENQWLYFTAYKGTFVLEGDPVDLQLLYQLGLSKRRSQGFGLLEVESEVN